MVRGGARLERFADALPNIRFNPLQPTDRLHDLPNLADIHVLPQRIDAADMVLPSEWTSMLVSGRPIAVTVSPGAQVADLVQYCGIVDNPGDAARWGFPLGLTELFWGKDRLLSNASSWPPAENKRQIRARRTTARQTGGITLISSKVTMTTSTVSAWRTPTLLWIIPGGGLALAIASAFDGLVEMLRRSPLMLFHRTWNAGAGIPACLKASSWVH